MIPKQSIITPEIVKERQDRHKRLMKMIKNYKKTNEEVQKLERIKDNTVLEINLRFLRSEHNKAYTFPKFDTDSDIDEKDVNPFASKNNQLYDLHTQNEILKDLTLYKLQESSKRVKSLDREKNEIESERIGRLQQTKQSKAIYSYKNLRKQSSSEVKRIVSTFRLPELSKKQNMKTESKNESIDIQKIIGKKLLTEVNSPSKKEKTAVNSGEYGSRMRKKIQSTKKLN